jgi:chromosomal replication initiator protein
MSTFWSHCLSHFERELSAQQFATWFRPLHAIEENDRLVVVAPNPFVGKWVRDRFMPSIERLATEYPSENTLSIDLRIDGSTGSSIVTHKTSDASFRSAQEVADTNSSSALVRETRAPQRFDSAPQN